MKPSPDTDMSYISFNKTHYCVRVKRLKVRVSFHITSMVSREQALADAIEFRDSLYKRYGLPSRSTRKPNVRVSSRNDESQISGVYLEIEKRGSKRYAYFNCKYKPGDLWLRKRFNISKLGYERAWLEALDHRLLHHPLGEFKTAYEMPRPSSEDYDSIKELAEDIPLPLEW